MDDRSSRNSSRRSQSVVLPPIERNSPERPSPRENQNLSEDHSPGSRPSLRERSQRDGRDSDKDINFVLSKLEFVERAVEEERRGRILLEDNMRAILVNVQRLSKDLASLQQQVKSEENTVHSQNVAMKNLELHQMAGIGDLWNRLTIGDLNSIKLSGDLNKITGEASDLKRAQEDSRRRVDKLQNVVDGLVTKLEKVNLDFEKKIHILEVRFETPNRGIDEKIKRIEEKYENNRNSNTEQKVEQHHSELLSSMEERLNTSTEMQKTLQVSFEERFSKFEARLSDIAEIKNKKEEDMVKRIREVSANQRTAFKKSQEKRHGDREAFRAVYESLTTMQTVLETKLKMTEADLKASINSIMRSIAHS